MRRVAVFLGLALVFVWGGIALSPEHGPAASTVREARASAAKKARTCRRDLQCRGGEICTAGLCVDAREALLPPKTCRRDTDCGSGEACVDQRCVPGPPTPVAVETPPVATVAKKGGATCRLDGDCRKGRICQDQRCRKGTRPVALPADEGMLTIAGGAFQMGFTEADIDRLQPECQRYNPDCTRAYFADAPAHEVSLADFAMDRMEVTVAEYATFLNTLGDHLRGCGGRPCAAIESEKGGARLRMEGPLYVPSAGEATRPIVNVSWWGAEAYCQWRGKRLPTEAEWEKAARGTDGRQWPWGDEYPMCTDTMFGNDVGGQADLCVGSLPGGLEPDKTAPVGSFPRDASPYGVLDMAGNVQEWVADWYAADAYGSGPRSDPRGPASGDRKVRRGGSWGHLATYTLSAFRDMTSPDTMGDLIGFRCAR